MGKKRKPPSKAAEPTDKSEEKQPPPERGGVGYTEDARREKVGGRVWTPTGTARPSGKRHFISNEPIAEALESIEDELSAPMELPEGEEPGEPLSLPGDLTEWRPDAELLQNMEEESKGES